MIDERRVKEIEDRIYEMTKQDDPSSILVALIHVIVFELSLTCPACRKRAAEDLTAIVPAILEEANKIAALTLSEDESAQPVCGHEEHYYH